MNRIKLVGHCPPQPVSLLGPAPTLSPSFQLAQAIFKPNLFPYKYPNFLNPSHSLYLPACEDGTGFQNVGKQNSDAGELPRRKHTTFRTRRKCEIQDKTSFFMIQFTLFKWRRSYDMYVINALLTTTLIIFTVKRRWNSELRVCLWWHIYSVFYINSCVTSSTSCKCTYCIFLFSSNWSIPSRTVLMLFVYFYIQDVSRGMCHTSGGHSWG
jgi:hypothetical protein